MADIANPQPVSEEEAKRAEEFEKQLKEIRELVAKSDTPASHGALGEILFRSEKDEYMKEAIGELQIAADAGIAGAKAYLGDAYFNGRGTEKDVPKAMDYFLDAALDGDVDSMYSLGAAYFMAKEVPADYGKAFDYLHEAASKGNSRAMNVLGLMFLGGFGVEQNISKAKRYFQKAMEHGNVHGKQNLNLIKEQGRRFDYRTFILASFEQPEAPSEDSQ